MILFLTALGAIGAMIIAIIAVNTLRFCSKQVQVEPAAAVSFDDKQAVEHLAQAVKFKTVVQDDRSFDVLEFQAFRGFLAQSFPLVHKHLNVELINEHSLLYTWRGQDPTQGGLLLLGHMDVVPVEPGTENNWTHPPFSGAIADGFVWGRGSWDCKSAVVGTLEAVEILLRDGYQPMRNIYLGFGHDEEVHGLQGAVHVADILTQRKVRLDMVVDEGGLIADGILPDIDKRVGLVGIAEKGMLSVELSTIAEGGHSSRPPSPDAIGLISQAITRLQLNPIPSKMTAPVGTMFDYLGPEYTGFKKVVMANRWLFGALVKRSVERTNKSLVHTTMVPTIFHAGVKENVVPSHASAIVNSRILPGQTADDVLAYMRSVIADERVKLTPRYGSGSPTEPRLDKGSFDLLAKTIRQIFPDTVVAPTLFIARTDSRHYEKLADSVYRFLPIAAKPLDLKRVHGTDERVSVSNYIEAVRFYHQLIINTTDKTRANYE